MKQLLKKVFIYKIHILNIFKSIYSEFCEIINYSLLIIWCHDEREKAEIENYILTEFAAKTTPVLSHFIKLKKFLLLKADHQRRLEHISEANFDNFSKEQIIESALLELELKKILQLINEHYENIYLNIQKKREFSENSFGFDEGPVKISESEYFKTDTENLFTGLNIVPGYRILVLSPESTVQAYEMLELYKPSLIILTELKLQQIRILESFSSFTALHCIVHQLYYKSTIEDYRFFYLSNKEKKAFSKITDEINNSCTLPPIISPKKTIKRMIAIDTREFSGPLPAYLMGNSDLLITPIMLSVGDYVLSEEICIERKAVSTNDLHESLKSGRLLHQVTSMCRYYKTPILLIEFDKSENFQLNENTEIIKKRLTILTIQFPKLQIIWSQSPHNSADIILKLMEMEKQSLLDLSRIEKIGKSLTVSEDSHGAIETYSPIELLSRINGITQDNINQILNNIRNIYELVLLPFSKLMEIIGKESGKTIYNFLHSEAKQ